MLKEENLQKNKWVRRSFNQIILIEFICANILLGIEDIHNQGFIHRDLNTKNLVFDSDGYLKIIDFGNSSTKPDNNY